MRSEFIKTMQERGFLHQCTDLEGLDRRLSEGIVTCYTGYDATAKSLHVGSLLSIMMMRWFQKLGHKPIILMGGGTTKVGDPSGKDESRKVLTEQDIAANIAGIKGVFSKFIKFGDGKTDAVMVNNAEWLDKLNYIDFLRDYGAHFTINRMLTFDSVKLRLEREQPLTFLEFNYMILQAYDFLELSRKYGCALQFGGSDQWGNIVNGVELGRRIDRKELFGFTTPLLTTASGAKMGKTASGAIWLNEDMLSPYDYYQFWRNTADGDLETMLKCFTELPIQEISELMAHGVKGINDAKKKLAFEATRMCHGEKAAQDAAETARRTFEEGAAAEGLPKITMSREKLAEGVPAFILFKDAGLAASGGEARRLIAGGGARVNDEKVESDQRMITLSDLNAEKTIKLSAGKKKHALVVVGD
ncbi:MAG: tyrosine--tRNA ligase [Alphaproteobacteria bacterium]|nr:MAG: tyrosine--tRNA ligase [Alphaproteobacteria bacterium]